MTAVLSWHVQKFVIISVPETESQQGKFSIEFELQVKSHGWNGPSSVFISSAHPRDKCEMLLN